MYARRDGRGVHNMGLFRKREGYIMRGVYYVPLFYYIMYALSRGVYYIPSV